MTHCRSSLEKPRSRWALGRAMFTIVRSSTIISCAMAIRVRISHRRSYDEGGDIDVLSGGRCDSGRPVLGERGELELVCRGARVLVGQEEHGIGDPARIGQGFRRDTAACGPVERVDAGV